MTIQPPSGREGQLRSAFTPILENLCQSCRGALAAGLVDEEGECVDLASLHVDSDQGRIPSMPAYRIKLTGAHFQIVMRQAAQHWRIGALRQLWVEAGERAYVSVGLCAGYVLVLVCQPQALASISPRALRQCEVELCREAGWPLPDPERPCWARVAVRLAESGAPAEVGLWSGWARLEAVVGLSAPGAFERAFEGRLPGGGRIVLVREATGFWFAAADPHHLYPSTSRRPLG